MRAQVLVGVVGLMCSGCAATTLDHEPVQTVQAEEAPVAVATAVAAPTESTPPPAPPAVVQPGVATDLCSGGGTFDFQVSGADFAAFEGRTVTAVAFVNDQLSSPAQGAPVVRLSTVIHNGAFSLSCPQSLSTNFYYPSWAVFVDTDGDGHCTGSDVGMSMALYGWDSDVGQALDPTWFGATASDVHGPIGGATGSFCTDYFE